MGASGYLDPLLRLWSEEKKACRFGSHACACACVRRRLGNLSVTRQTGRTTRAGCGAGAKACREGRQDATPALEMLGWVDEGGECVCVCVCVCGHTLGGGAAVTCTEHGFGHPMAF
jgi:hypothetical protein